MKSKKYLWLLASAYLAWGVYMFSFIPKFKECFAGSPFSPPFLVKAMFLAGPFGCALLAIIIGVFVALNIKWFHVRFVSLISMLFLMAWVGYLSYVVFTTFPAYIARWLAGLG
jgi:hypothetical protein